MYMDDNRIINKLLEHDEHFERLRERMGIDTRTILSTIEGLATLCKKMEQELIFTNSWLRRLQTHSEKQEERLDHITQTLRAV